MLLLYRIIINIVLIISPLILIPRIINKKETPKSFFEKIGNIRKKRVSKGKLIWIHGSSVGEILGAVPLIEKLEKRKDISQILITSNTVSSSKVIEGLRLNKIIHQFFPIDTNILSRKFLNYWKPNLAIFIESEIWPNMVLEINRQKIPLILLNARFTKKTFKRWSSIKIFSKRIISKFDLCLPQNNETNIYLKKLGAYKIKKAGNLKFCEPKISINKNNKIFSKNFLNQKKILFCAVSTHYNEENFCAKIHSESKKIFNNISTIIIPRHVNRSFEIKNNLEKIGLNVQLHSLSSNINGNTDIYLVDTYGETKKFLNLCNIAFLGGSLVDYKGHNPMEAARLGLKVIHGKYISNHLESYEILKKIKISKKINNVREALNFIKASTKNKSNSKKARRKLIKIGKIILSNNFKETCKYI